MYPLILWVHLKKRSTKDLCNVFVCVFFFLRSVFIKAYVMGTHLNCMDKLHVNTIPMGIHIICLYKEIDKKYTGFKLKAMERLDCALLGVCAVIRSNMVVIMRPKFHTIFTLST